MIKEEFLRRSNLPPSFGGFNNLLRTALSNKGTSYDFIDGLDQGVKAGLARGSENAIKSFIIGGDKQIFVTKDGKIIPFHDKEQLFENPETKELIKEYVVYNGPKSEKEKILLLPTKTEIKLANLNTDPQALNVENKLNNLLNKFKPSNINEPILNQYKRYVNDEERLLKEDLYKSVLIRSEPTYTQKQIKNHYDRVMRNPLDYSYLTEFNTKFSSTIDKIEIDRLHELHTNIYKNVHHQEKISKFEILNNYKNELHNEINKERLDIKKEIELEKLERMKDNPTQDYLWKAEFRKMLNNPDDKIIMKTPTKKNKSTTMSNPDYKNNSIFLTDDFNIVHLANLDKIFKDKDKKAPLYDAHIRVEQRSNYILTDKDLKYAIKDNKSKKINSNIIGDYIEVPHQKLSIDYEELTKQKYKSPILPTHILKYIEDVKIRK